MGLILGSALTVGSRNFKAVGNMPFSILLDDGRELSSMGEASQNLSLPVNTALGS